MNDSINPNHYKQGNIEIIECIGSIVAPLKGRPGHAYSIGNAVKYLARFATKQHIIDGEIEDLEKAKRYIDFVLDELKEQRTANELKLRPGPHSSGTIGSTVYSHNGPAPTIKYGDQV